MTDEANGNNGGGASAGPLTGEALAQHKALLADPEWQAAASGRSGHTAYQNAMARLEAISKGAPPSGQGFQKPGVTSDQLKSDPGYQDDASGKNGYEAQVNAANQLDDIGRNEMLADTELTDAEASELAKLMTPNSATDYANADGLGFDMGEAGAQARQILLDHQIPPQAVKELAPVAGKIAAMSDDAYFASIDSAKDTVMRWPGGPALIDDAVAYLNSIADDHPLARIAEVAAAEPRGIKWLAFMHRQGQRAA